MSNTPCTRCGKQNPADIHTCTPLALRLADALLEPVVLDKHAMQAAAELRRLHAENEALRAMSFDTKRSLESEAQRDELLHALVNCRAVMAANDLGGVYSAQLADAAIEAAHGIKGD